MKNKEIDQRLLKPLEGIQKAQPSPALFNKIEASIFDAKIIPMQRLKWIAASVLILISANIYALSQSINTTESSSTETLVTDFTLYKYEN
ncbi:MAG: hypothetical protein AB8B72_01405 [Crocinitomicaceae bacterium]